MAASCEKILHQSALELDKKEVNVTLTPKYVAVEHIVKQKQCDSGLLDVKQVTTHCQVISLDEVIAVQPHASAVKDSRKTQSGGVVYQSVEMQPVRPLSFDMYVLKRIPKHRWRYRVMTFTCKDPVECSAWIDKMRSELYAPGSNRPKHLLVFINPFGGKKRAPKVFEKVRPLFDTAGISLEVIETQRQNHAREMLLTYDLSTVDGVICVGGDGTFSEILNGLLDRTNADEGVEQSFRHQPARPRLRVGIIPAGSTDSIVCTTVGANDPTTSALQIIIGTSIGVDVNSLYKEEKFVKYSVTMTSYGYYGDLLADSERFRWMGPKRYTFSGFKKIVLNNAYEGEVSFIPASKNSGDPQDGNFCYSGCVQCQRAGTEAQLAYSDRVKKVPTFDLGSGESGGNEAATASGGDWCRISGKFVAINLVTVSCRCSLSPQGMSPYTHLGDGCMDLILIQDCSRTDYLRHLIRIPRKDSNQFDLDFVKVYRIKEFQFRPVFDPEEEKLFDSLGEGGGDERRLGDIEAQKSCPVLSASGSVSSMSEYSLHSSSSRKSLKSSSSRTSVWNCDGEVVSHPCLYVQVHCQLIQLFASGVENNKVEPETCPVCCHPCSRCS